MLLRIEPDMFKDERFKCKTIREIHEEIVRTTKFKKKYPWIEELKAEIKTIILDEEQKLNEKKFFETIKEVIYQGTENLKTGHLFDLSCRDMRVLSHALALGYKTTSCDRNLFQFAYQEFKQDFKGNVFPLDIINDWFESDVIEWNEEKQKIIQEWEVSNEPAQPVKAKKRFKKITGFNYPK